MALMPIEKAVTELDPASDEARLLFDESPEATMDWIEHFLTVPNELGQRETKTSPSFFIRRFLPSRVL